MDRLFDAVSSRGPVCVGLDTAAEYMPPAVPRLFDRLTDAVLAYNKALVDATIDLAACYKVQIAYYEALGRDGMAVYADTLAYIRARGGLAIADVKRGDIADTASRYADAHFSGDFEADFVTLNPYMGMDTLAPWLAAAKRRGKGAFVLTRTSNPGSADFQTRELKDGGRLCGLVARSLARLAETDSGERGYGLFGAVAGCTDREEAAFLRREHPRLFFLIPGYGAQGGGAEDAAALLNADGNGGGVNASRSILKAWEKLSPQPDSIEGAAEAARDAVFEMRRRLAEAVAKKG
jgi:orotidine-5'-phosphate decarboxylase